MIKDYLLWLAVLLGLSLFSYLVHRSLAVRRGSACVRREPFIYEEWFASGVSGGGSPTRFGGATHCLRLVITQHFLWVTLWPPFVLFGLLYDLEHVVPLEGVLSVERSSHLWMERLTLTYADERGVSHTLCLIPRRLSQFLEAMRLPAKKLSLPVVDA